MTKISEPSEFTEEERELILCPTRRKDCKAEDCATCGWVNRINKEPENNRAPTKEKRKPGHRYPRLYEVDCRISKEEVNKMSHERLSEIPINSLDDFKKHVLGSRWADTREQLIEKIANKLYSVDWRCIITRESYQKEAKKLLSLIEQPEVKGTEYVVAEAVKQERERILSEFGCLELAQYDDGYYRILAEDTLAYIRTGKRRVERTLEAKK